MMSPQIALNDPVFRAYFWIVLIFLAIAGVVLAERFIVHASLGGSENSTKLIYLLLGLRFIRLRAR